MIKGFKDFIARGNVMDLAVGVIIAGAFTAIVTALNEYVLSPLIAGIFGKPNFDNIWTISLGNDATVLPGTLITAGINFLIVAAALYFFVVVPMSKLKRDEVEDTPAKTDETILLEEIRDLLQSERQL